MSHRISCRIAGHMAFVLLAVVFHTACGASPQKRSDSTGHAWAVAERTILATTDGGTTWVTQAADLPPGHSLRGVAFADPQTGWVVGSLTDLRSFDVAPGDITSVVSLTTDGGADWTQQTLPVRGVARDLVCTDRQHVWAAGGWPDSQWIVASSDGGHTWATQFTADAPRDAPGGLTSLAFADADHGWTVLGNGDVLATTDGGSNWAVQTTLEGTDGYLSVAFADGRNGWAGGTVMPNTRNNQIGQALVWATTDGGTTWKEAPGPESAVGVASLACTDAQHLWAGGDTIYRSTDGGATWIAGQTPGEFVGALDMSFADSLHGWAAESNKDKAGILATTDGGATWTRQYKGASSVSDVTCPVEAGSSGK